MILWHCFVIGEWCHAIHIDARLLGKGLFMRYSCLFMCGKKKGYSCLFMCHTQGTAPLTYEKQVFSGTRIQCEQFVHGFQKGRQLLPDADGSMSELANWLQKNKEKHTCCGEIIPVYHGINTFYDSRLSKQWRVPMIQGPKGVLRPARKEQEDDAPLGKDFA